MKVIFTMFLKHHGQHKNTKYKLITTVKELPQVGVPLTGMLCPHRGCQFVPEKVDMSERIPIILLRSAEGGNFVINGKKDPEMLNHLKNVGWIRV
jgi:hypothetical protein